MLEPLQDRDEYEQREREIAEQAQGAHDAEQQSAIYSKTREAHAKNPLCPVCVEQIATAEEAVLIVLTGRVVHGAGCFAIALSQQAHTLSKYGQRAMRVLRGGRMSA